MSFITEKQFWDWVASFGMDEAIGVPHSASDCPLERAARLLIAGKWRVSRWVWENRISHDIGFMSDWGRRVVDHFDRCDYGIKSPHPTRAYMERIRPEIFGGAA